MSEGTNIQWCDATWNPWRGCTKVSGGCKNCYAETLVINRLGGGRFSKGVPRVRQSEANFNAPLRWNKKPWVCDECGHNAKLPNEECDCGAVGAGVVKRHRRRVFSLSLGDWLDAEVPLEWLCDMLSVIEKCPNLDFLLLTKRPQNALSRIAAATDWPESNVRLPPNVWFGFSAENQEAFDQRWKHAKSIPAKQLFVSFEPLLGPVTLPAEFMQRKPWPIYGGESGKGARPCNVDWIRQGIQQFAAHHCPVFVKQLGKHPEWPPGGHHTLSDKHGADPAEWPQDLRVRQWPA